MQLKEGPFHITITRLKWLRSLLAAQNYNWVFSKKKRMWRVMGIVMIASHRDWSQSRLDTVYCQILLLVISSPEPWAPCPLYTMYSGVYTVHTWPVQYILSVLRKPPTQQEQILTMYIPGYVGGVTANTNLCLPQYMAFNSLQQPYRLDLTQTSLLYIICLTDFS